MNHGAKKVRCGAIAFALLLSLVAQATAADPNEFEVFSLTGGSGNVILPGRLYVPPEAISHPETPRPLILFLHGAGQRGTNNTSQVAGMNGLFHAAVDRGAYLYAPQIPTTADWENATLSIDQMLDRALAEHNVDVDRMYITGISLGGGGTWTVMSALPDRFAAGMPVSGTGGVPQPFRLMEQTIWAFHSRDDDVVNVSSTRNNIAQMLIFAGEPLPQFPFSGDRTTTLDFHSSTLDLRYTEYPTGGHGVGSSRIYLDDNVYDWMFDQTLAVPEPGSVVLLGLGGAMLLFQARRARRAARHDRPR